MIQSTTPTTMHMTITSVFFFFLPINKKGTKQDGANWVRGKHTVNHKKDLNK